MSNEQNKATMNEGTTHDMLEQAKELLSQLPNLDYAGMLGSHMMYSHTDHFGHTDVYPVSMSNLESFVAQLKKSLKSQA